ncbi:hypothetical protein ACFPRL_03625 [Pseudoclavibacter helvolus]
MGSRSRNIHRWPIDAAEAGQPACQMPRTAKTAAIAKIGRKSTRADAMPTPRAGMRLVNGRSLVAYDLVSKRRACSRTRGVRRSRR